MRNDLKRPLVIGFICLGMAAVFLASLIFATQTTEIMDATGDGGGNILNGAFHIAVEKSGNVYVTGLISNNAFKITTGGVITEIIDATGDGGGNVLDGASGIAVDRSGNVYVTGRDSDNAFKITTGGVITEVIDATGDGGGNTLDGPLGIAVDKSGNVSVTGFSSDNAFNHVSASPVGGVAELPEVATSPLETDGSSGTSAGVLAGTIAVAVLVGSVSLGGAAWYARRRLSG